MLGGIGRRLGKLWRRLGGLGMLGIRLGMRLGIRLGGLGLRLWNWKESLKSRRVWNEM